jgi:hypoxanthine phosphoribosyltransferase
MKDTIQIIRSQDEIQKRINSLTEEIRSKVGNEDLTVVGILDDSFVFFADLIRALNMPVNCCFLKVTKHEEKDHTDILYISEFEPAGKNILLVGGVMATGVTLDYLVKHLEAGGVKSLRTCMLVDKPGERRVDIKPDFAAFENDEGYLFGYGLGLESQYRHLPYLAVMK